MTTNTWTKKYLENDSFSSFLPSKVQTFPFPLPPFCFIVQTIRPLSPGRENTFSFSSLRGPIFERLETIIEQRNVTCCGTEHEKNCMETKPLSYVMPVNMYQFRVQCNSSSFHRFINHRFWQIQQSKGWVVLRNESGSWSLVKASLARTYGKWKLGWYWIYRRKRRERKGGGRETVFDLSVNIPWRRAVGFIKTNWNDNEEGERRCNDIENGRMKLQRFKYWPPPKIRSKIRWLANQYTSILIFVETFPILSRFLSWIFVNGDRVAR